MPIDFPTSPNPMRAKWSLPVKAALSRAMFTDDDATNPAPELLTLVHDGDRFQLYKVRKPENAAQNAPALPR